VAILRPGIVSESGPHVSFAVAVDQMGRMVARAHGATDDDESVSDELIHECSVLIPAVLITDASRVVPGWAVDQGAQEVPHALAR
jgi:hypothetical protein